MYLVLCHGSMNQSRPTRSGGAHAMLAPQMTHRTYGSDVEEPPGQQMIPVRGFSGLQSYQLQHTFDSLSSYATLEYTPSERLDVEG